MSLGHNLMPTGRSHLCLYLALSELVVCHAAPRFGVLWFGSHVHVCVSAKLLQPLLLPGYTHMTFQSRVNSTLQCLCTWPDSSPQNTLFLSSRIAVLLLDHDQKVSIALF